MGYLVHLANQFVDLVCAVARVAAFDKVQDLLLAEATVGIAQLEWPQEVAGLLKVRANRVDFVDQIFNANDAELTKRLFDNGVVRERDTLLVNLAVTTLVDQFADRLEVGRAKRNVRLHQLEHLHRAVGQAHKDTRVDLEKTQKLHNLARLGRNLVDTLDTNNKGQLGFSRDEKVAGSLGFATHADFIAFGGAVLVDVLLGALEDDGALLFVGLLQSQRGDGAFRGQLFNLLALLQDRFGGDLAMRDKLAVCTRFDLTQRAQSRLMPLNGVSCATTQPSNPHRSRQQDKQTALDKSADL